MPNYRVIKSSQRRMYAVMGLRPRFVESALSKLDPETYNQQLAKDSERATLLASNGKSKQEIKSQLFSPSESGSYYGQGDFEGSTFLTTFFTESLNNFRMQYRIDKNQEYQCKLGFTYIDDDGYVCGLSIECYMEEPPKFAIGHIRNVNAEQMEDRQTTVIYEESLPTLFKAEGDEPIDESAQAKYLDGDSKPDDADEKNQLNSSEFDDANLKVSLLNLLNSDEASTVVGLLFNCESLNPDAIANFSMVLELQSFIETAGISSSSVFDSEGLYEKNNFKNKLIEIYHTAQESKQQQLAIQYLRYVANDYGLLADDPLLKELSELNDTNQTVDSIILKYVKRESPNQRFDIESINKYFNIYQEFLLLTSYNQYELQPDSQVLREYFPKYIKDNLSLDKYLEQITYLSDLLKLAGYSDEQIQEEQAKFSENPEVYFNPDNFQRRLIGLINEVSIENRSQAISKYLKYSSLSAINLSDPIYTEIEKNPDKPISKVLLEAVTRCNNDGDKAKANSYYEMYLLSLAASTDVKSEQIRILQKIKYFKRHRINTGGIEKQEAYQLELLNTEISDAVRIARQQIELEEELSFDPQGRILVELENSVVSIDVSGYDDLQSSFNDKLKSFLPADNADNIIAKYSSLKSKNSIIFLQQEMHFHLSLALKVYNQQLSLDFSNEQLQAIHAQTMQSVNEDVMRAFAHGLDIATDGGESDLNIFKLNGVLAASRGSIIQNAHDNLIANVIKTKPEVDLEKFNETKAKDLASHTTATNKRILHQDIALATITEIGASNITSHDRNTETFAHRGIKRYRYDDKTGEVLYCLPGNKVRSPSLPVKTGLASEQAYIDDAANKISETKEFYEFNEPFTYNLLTAMKDYRGDLNGNLQTQSARHIILGAHQYNRVNEPICLVQAISVNGFGRPLGYSPYRRGLLPLADEATLLSEMTLCFNIERDENFLAGYNDFVQKPVPTGFFAKIGFYLTGGTKYFVKSAEGQAKLEEIAAKKKSWQASQEVDPDNYVDLARTGLRKVMAYDLHFGHDYAKLVQSLSLFVEEEAVFGCKSGNERTPIIDERGQLFERPDLPEELINAFKTLAAANTEEATKSAAAGLKLAIDECYNRENLYGSTALIPLVDQGGGHKIKAATGSALDTTNHAEESNITNLVQDNVAEMQAHKEMTTYMDNAVQKAKLAMQTFKEGQSDITSSYSIVGKNIGVRSPSPDTTASNSSQANEDSEGDLTRKNSSENDERTGFSVSNDYEPVSQEEERGASFKK